MGPLFATMIRKNLNAKNGKNEQKWVRYGYRNTQIGIQDPFFAAKIKNIHGYSPEIDPYSLESTKRPIFG